MRTILITMILAVFLAACGLQGEVVEPQGPTGMATDDEPNASMPVNETDTEEQDMAEEDVPYEDFDGVTLNFTEGDLVILTPEAVDPDGDMVSYEFGAPVGSDGQWQTEIGDEGRYLVDVVASDGKATTREKVLLVIERANRAPVIDCVDEARLREGERFYVGDYCDITDADGEEVVVQYSGWPGFSQYVTTYDDAGMHTLKITANDKTHIVKEELSIKVIDVNRKPAFPSGFPERVVGMEGDIITIETDEVSDPDGDKLSFQFSEPFNDEGIWRTELGDAGTYDVDVVASDGEATAKATVTVEVQLANTKPTLQAIPDIEVDEGETIELPISASDREGDELTVEIEGWMTSRTYETTYDDAGEYTVRVTVSDGVNEASQVVHITVNDVNRPPRFISPA